MAGIDMQDEDGFLNIEYYEAQLVQMLETAKVPRKTSYRSKEVCALLGISDTTFRRMCDDWSPQNPEDGIECYLVGLQRRVPHHALVEWLHRNNHYVRQFA